MRNLLTSSHLELALDDKFDESQVQKSRKSTFDDDIDELWMSC